jgi:hypothetical protein
MGWHKDYFKFRETEVSPQCSNFHRAKKSATGVVALECIKPPKEEN